MKRPEAWFVLLIIDIAMNSTASQVIGIIKELPDVANMSVFDTSDIKPTKCKRPSVDSVNLPPPIPSDRKLRKPPVRLDFIHCSTPQNVNNTDLKKKEHLNEKTKRFERAKETLDVHHDAKFYEIDYFDTDSDPEYYFLLQGPEPPDLGDFDELPKAIVEFNEFGSNFKSEIIVDKDEFDYYENFDRMLIHMKNRDTVSASPPMNAVPVFIYDDDYEDFGTLLTDEEQTDYEDYCESMRYFYLLDRLTRRHKVKFTSGSKRDTICKDFFS